MIGPPLRLCGEGVTLERLLLPRDVVPVLHGERGQRIGGARGERVVKAGDLVVEHAARPTVRDDVVHAEHQNVLLRAQRQKLGTEERAAFEVVGPTRRLLHVCPQGRFVGYGHDVERHGPRRGDPGAWLSSDAREHRPQRLVALDDTGDGLLERGAVERTDETDRGEQIVRSTLGIHLVQQPQPPLGEGRHAVRPAVGSGGQRRPARVGRLRSGFADTFGQSGHRGVLEQHPDRDAHPCLRPEAGHDPHREE